MYYYLYEPSKSRADRNHYEHIKRLIAEIGITGESVSPTPARSIDELVDIGIGKGYATLVGIGSDLFANRIVSSMLNRQKELEHRVVFGFIPINYTSSKLAKIIGVNSTKEALDTIRYRKVIPYNVGMISPRKFFITPLLIAVTKSLSVRIIFPSFDVDTSISDVIITPEIKISWDNNFLYSRGLSKLFNKIINKEDKLNYYSSFFSDNISIETSSNINVYLESEVIAKTPIHISSVHQRLHLIVTRDKIKSERKE